MKHAFPSILALVLATSAFAAAPTAAPLSALPPPASLPPAAESSKSTWWKFWQPSRDAAALSANASLETPWVLTLRDGAVRSILPSSLSFSVDAAPAAVPFSPARFSSLSVSIPPPPAHFSFDAPAPAPTLVATLRAAPARALSAPLPKTLRARAVDGEKIVVPWTDVFSLSDPSVRAPASAPQTTLPVTVALHPTAAPGDPVPVAFPVALLPLKAERFTIQVPSWLLRSIAVNPDRSVTVVSVYGDVLSGALPLRRIPGFEQAASVTFPQAAPQTPPPGARLYRLASSDILSAVPSAPAAAPNAAFSAAPRSLRAAAAAPAASAAPDSVDLIPCLDPYATFLFPPAFVETSAPPASPLPPSTRPYAPSARAVDEILVPAASFRIGTAAPNAPRDETPPAPVSLDSFYLASTPVTVAQFAAFIDDTSHRPTTSSDGISWQNPGFPQTPSDPVVAVSWRDAVSYCNWLSRKAGLAPAYSIPSDLSKPVVFDPAAPGYRLPLEAEWELAARDLGKPISFPWGNDPAETNIVRLANFSPVTVSSPWPFTSPVKTFPPSPLGFYDLAGNVAEWCQDAYQPDAYAAFYPTQNYAPLLNPDAPCARVIRGGSYLNTRGALRTTARAYGLEIAGIPNEVPPRPRCGFRVARNAP